MAYSYTVERERVLSDEGQKMLLTMWDTAQRLLREAGAVRMDALMRDLSGDSWMMLACADRLVELKRLREIHYGDCVGQHRIFVAVN